MNLEGRANDCSGRSVLTPERAAIRRPHTARGGISVNATLERRSGGRRPHPVGFRRARPRRGRRGHHRLRQGHVLSVRSRSAEAGEAERHQRDGASLQGLDREHLRGLSAAGRAAGHRAIGRARLRRAPAERSGAHPDRQENQDGLSALQRGSARHRQARDRRLRRPGRQAGRRWTRRQRHVPDRPAALQAVRGRSQRDGPHRHRRGAGRAEGRADRRDVLRGRVPGPPAHAKM